MKTNNYYYQLAMTISQLQQQGKIVSVKQLPSTINRKRKSYLWNTLWRIIRMNYYSQLILYNKRNKF